MKQAAQSWRNKLIFLHLLDGDKLEAIEIDFRLSHERIRDICIAVALWLIDEELKAGGEYSYSDLSIIKVKPNGSSAVSTILIRKKADKFRDLVDRYWK